MVRRRLLSRYIGFLLIGAASMPISGDVPYTAIVWDGDNYRVKTGVVPSYIEAEERQRAETRESADLEIGYKLDLQQYRIEHHIPLAGSAQPIPSAGGHGGAAMTFSPSGQAFFIANDFSNQVTSYSVDLESGDLAPAPGAPYPTGDNPQSLTVDPSGRFLYVANTFDDTISAFAVDLQTSELRSIGIFPGGDTPAAIASSRNFVFATNVGNHHSSPYAITVLRIDQASGALSAVPGSPFRFGAWAPFDLVVTPEGRFLYGSGGLGYAVDPSTGALTPVPGAALNLPVTALAMHPSLPFLFVAMDTEIRSYRFDYFTGALTEAGTPAPSESSSVLAVHPMGDALYAASSNTLMLTSFALDRVSGQLSSIGTPVALVDAPDSMAVRHTSAQALAAQGVPYSNAIEVRGGYAPFGYSITSGSLPAGLSLDALTGRITGTPTTVGLSTFLSKIKDAVGNLAYRVYTIQVIPAPAAPAAPTGLMATPLSPAAVSLSWQDGADGTGGFRIEASLDGGPYAEVDTAGPFQTSRVVDGLSAASRYTFRVRASNPGGASAYSGTADATTLAGSPTSCTASETVGCLLGGRFQLEAYFQTSKGQLGAAHVVRLTSDTVYLWFFAESNVEAVVKVLDGCGNGGHYWMFAGGLTNVRVSVKLTDTRTGAIRGYENPIGTAFIPIQATNAFGTCNAAPASTDEAQQTAFEMPPLSEEAASWRLPSASAACTPGDTAMCLDGARFKVEATYLTKDGRTGPAHMHQITPDTGYMWFFADTNVEAVVKVLNACAGSQHHWVFAGGLTNVDVQMTVTDTATGEVRPYHNPLGTPFQPIQDTSAFICP